VDHIICELFICDFVCTFYTNKIRFFDGHIQSISQPGLDNKIQITVSLRKSEFRKVPKKISEGKSILEKCEK